MARLQNTSLTDSIACVHRCLNAMLDATLQGEGLTVEQWRVLENLSDREGRAMGDLAAAVLMNHPALTKMMDRMVADGMVHRAPDEADQRRVLVFLTDRGFALYRRVKPKVDAHDARLRRAIGVSDARALSGLLAQAISTLATVSVKIEQN